MRPLPPEPAAETFNMTPMIDIVFQLLIFFMLTMHFQEVEGKLLSQLPKHGHAPGHADVREEVRIVICAGGDVRAHLNDKGAHEKHVKDGSVCAASVDRVGIGDLFKTADRPDRQSHNRAHYRALAAKAKEIHDLNPGRSTAIILDADSEVPYEHVIGAVNACQEAGLHKVEFAASPRYAKIFASPR